MSIIGTIGELKTSVKAVLAIVIVGASVGIYMTIPSSVKDQVTDKLSLGTTQTSTSTTSASIDKPINVCVNTWGGFAGGQWYNGGFAASKNSRFYKEQGILVNFIKMDDFNGTRNAWKAGECDLMWGTIDSFVTEADGLSDQNPEFSFEIDKSRGGDVAVSVREVKSINDLRGRKLAVAFGTPSHSLLLWGLNSSGMTPNDVEIVNTNEEPAAVSAFKGHQVDAAIVWSPDDRDLYDAIPGSHALFSTKEATDIITDSLFYKKAWVKANRERLSKLYRGFMIGNATVNTNPAAFEEAVKITAKGYTQSEDFMREAIRNVRLTTHGDNRNFFGLTPGYTGVKAEDIYSKTGDLYKKMKFIDKYPTYRSVSDPSIIADVTDLDTPDQLAEGAKAFAKPTSEVANAEPLATKPVTVNFALNSSLLDERSQSIIDEKLVDVARQFRDSYIRIEGNTDSTGDPMRNETLSRDRANSVASYLASQYKFDRARFIVVGNGSKKPVCEENNSDRPLDACRAMNRRTEFQVLRTK